MHTNKFKTTLMVYSLTNMLSSSFSGSPSFDVFLKDDLIYSRTITGKMPTAEDLIKMIN